jgi:DNA invertase Pin-like site-specific DNA recombinase
MINDGDGIKSVALYTRVSTEDQARKGFSLDSQLDRLRSYCKAREWVIIDEYVDDGYTGRNIKRPQYQRMMQDIKNWDAILVIKMDRIHRNSKNFIIMMEELRSKSKQFVSMTESLDTSTAIGRFIMKFTQDLAQLESEQIGERTFATMKYKAQDPRAGWVGSRPPYGYRRENGEFVEIPEELEIVKRIFQLYNKGWSNRKLRDKFGLTKSGVLYILHNPIYAGVGRWCHWFKKLDIKPVVSKELFNQTQRELDNRRNNHKDQEHLQPLQLKKEDTFELSEEELKHIPEITKPKHNTIY